MGSRVVIEIAGGVEEIEIKLQDLGLSFRQIELKTKSQIIHWHIQKPGTTGTLEADFSPTQKTLTLIQRSNRSAPWQDPIVQEIKRSLSLSSN